MIPNKCKIKYEDFWMIIFDALRILEAWNPLIRAVFEPSTRGSFGDHITNVTLSDLSFFFVLSWSIEFAYELGKRHHIFYTD